MNIVPFDSGKVPAAISNMFGDAKHNDLIGTQGGGFPTISIKGKVFHITRGDDKSLITKPGEDDPAASIEVVVLRANPNNSKVFYVSGYQEGSVAKPDCFSNDGVTPEASSQEPQAKNCATCVHNQWGSKIGDTGRKGKACADSKRIAIATLEAPADAIMLRVPAASLKALGEYGKMLAARGVRPEVVVTRIGFDYSVAHPALTFKPVGFIGDADKLGEIKDSVMSELVAQIVGVKAADPSPVVDEKITPVPRAAKPKPEVVAALPPAGPRLVDTAVATSFGTKKVSVAVEEPAPAKQAAPDKVATPAKEVSMEDDILAMLDGLDLDD